MVALFFLRNIHIVFMMSVLTYIPNSSADTFIFSKDPLKDTPVTIKYKRKLFKIAAII